MSSSTRTIILGFAAVLTSFVSFSSAQVSVIDGPIRSPINGHFFSVLSNSDWTTAQSAAQSMGGNLATVRSAAEEAWIEQTFSSHPFLWIGLYDPIQSDFGPTHTQHFVWVDGEPVTYLNWANGEPNDFNGEEYWTQLVLTNSSTIAPNKWNDIYNSPNPQHSPNSYGPDFGLVEVVPEPASLTLSALACLPLLLRRRNRLPQ